MEYLSLLETRKRI